MLSSSSRNNNGNLRRQIRMGGDMRARVLVSILLAIVIGSLLSLAGPTQNDPARAAEKAAVKAAESWLALVDSGEYEESWRETAKGFREKVTMEQWRVSVNSARQPLGKFQSRKLKGAKYTTKLPNAPDGEYVIIQFESTFDNKPLAVETIVPVLDQDGKWRVSGYFVK